MNRTEREQWNSRPTQVRVLDLCEPCGQLRDDVTKRVAYWPKHLELNCCAPCMDAAIAKAREEKERRFIDGEGSL